MNASFDLNHAELAVDPRFAGIAQELSALSPINSRKSFNRYCREACRLWNEKFPDGIGETEQFVKLLDRIEHTNDGVIRTGWGGVVITLHEHPRVEKYLVVRKGGYLALEMHEQKDERLEIREGAGLILSRPPNDRSLTVEVLRPGSEFHFPPGIEHCIIGTEDLLVFERSIDPKGMDQDLIFIYEPDAVASPACPPAALNSQPITLNLPPNGC
jgi:mannose-6-phosphate isomerase-like protein (cupin superfamily)